MPDNNSSQVTHLTSLDLEISGIKKSLEEAQSLIEQYSYEIGRTANENIKKAMESGVNGDNTLLGKNLIDSKEVEKATTQVQGLAKEVAKLDEKGNVLSQMFTFDNQQGDRVIEYWKKVGDISKKVGEQQVTDYAKKQKLQEQETKNLSKTVSELEKMAKKQKEFTANVEKQKPSLINKSIINESKQYTNQIEQLIKQIKQKNNVTEEEIKLIDELKDKYQNLSRIYQDVGDKGQSFVSQILDKAKWLSAFYVVEGFKDGLKATAQVLKETEDAVVQIQRILNEDISQSQMTKQLNEIAFNYGRSFADVQEVATRFAQTGATWNETLEQTKATMLALNTAELDVSQATEGLIAVMAQWKFEATEMETVIDKINITADSFAITSEKIVAALQRASGTAKSAGISFEETLGIITALGEATGRSGETIGTALNSLINFTQTEKAFETFKEVGDANVRAVIDKYDQGAASILDIWTALSNNVKNLTKEQEEALYQGLGGDSFTAELEQTASTAVAELQQIYGAAGNWRKNWLIALLQDMGTVEEVLENLGEAQGYSLRENQSYMETLTSQYEQLQIALRDLAIQLGESGLMNFLKEIVQAGIELAKLTKDIGGVQYALVGVASIVTLLMSKKISSRISSLAFAFKSLISPIEKIGENLINGKKALDGFNKAAVSVSSVVVNGFSLIAIAVTTVISLVNKHNTQLREMAISTAKEANNQAKSLFELAKQYTDIIDSEMTEEERVKSLTALKETLNEQYGIEKERLDAINSSREDGIKLIQEEIEAQAQKAIAGLGDEYEKAKAAIERPNVETFFLGEKILQKFQSTINVTEDELKQLEKTYQDLDFSEPKGIGKVKSVTFDVQADSLYQRQKILYENIAKIRLEGNEATEAELVLLDKLQSEYNSLSKEIDKFGEVYDEGTYAMALGLVSSKMEELSAIDTAEGLEKYKKALLDSLDESEEFETTVSDIIDKFFGFSSATKEAEGGAGDLANALDITEEDLKKATERFDELSTAMDRAQSGIDSVYSALEQYNTQGYLTIDTLQNLLSSGYEYIQMLEFTENGVRINDEALANFINTQRTNALELIKQAAAADVLKVTQEYLSTETQKTDQNTKNFGETADTTAVKLANLASQAIGDAQAMALWNQEYSKIMGNIALPPTDVNALKSKIDNVIGTYQNLWDNLQTGFGKVETYSNEYSRQAADAVRESTQAQKKYYEQQKEAVRDRYEFEKKKIQEAQEAVRKKYEAEREALEDRKDEIQDYYDKQIDALKKVQKENDRLAQQEDYLRRKREAEKDIAQASVRSGVEYREREEEARDELSQIEKDWQKQLEDWEIEDKIEALEDARDEALDAIEEQLDALDDLEEAELEKLEQRLEFLEEEKDKKLDAIDAQIDALSGANATNFANYQSQYLIPVEESTKETFARTFGEVNNIQSNFSSDMFSVAQSNADKLYSIYKSNFVDRLSVDLSNLSEELSNLGMMGMNAVPYVPKLNFIGPPEPSYTYNTNSNSNVFANIYGEQAAKGFASGIFTKP